MPKFSAMSWTEGDFLIDADLKAWLCEINASPAVAEELMPKLVRDLIGTYLHDIIITHYHY